MTLVDLRSPNRLSALKNQGSRKVASMPAEFRSLEESRMYLELLVRRLPHLMASINAESESLNFLKLDTIRYIPKWYTEERDRYLAEHEKWHEAFTLFLSRTQPSKTNSLGAKALKLQYLSSYFAAAGIRTSEEPWSDTRRFMPMLREIISLVKQILRDPRTEREEGMFSIAMKVICPLFGVAWRCPHRALQKEAIGLLLSSRRREGLWDSIFAGRLTQWIMELEDENSLDVEGEYVPDCVRSAGFDILTFDAQTRRMRVRCLLPEWNFLEWKIRETVITW
ncbi:hypothetical protein LSUE1_G003039 [Lachnellula suecica]|uniref:Uncharacterized protein n=1 Tax=Lachnellula suecica TaxID=602035 RepID=A0A8T9CBS1_9HELO|nr:hypothetical protein LSUE1_G003039 [Lachnellula suecica]